MLTTLDSEAILPHGIGFEHTTGGIVSFKIDSDVFSQRRIDREGFIHEARDPFALSDVDYLYLNSDFIYQLKLLQWFQDSIMAQSSVPVELERVNLEFLTGLGLNLTEQQRDAFCEGHPIWRRTALSCTGGVGRKTNDISTSKALRDALVAWIPLTHKIAKYAMVTDSTRPGSPFLQRPKSGCGTLTEHVLTRALGNQVGSKKPFGLATGLDKPTKVNLVNAKLGYPSSYKEAENSHFKKHFGAQIGEVSQPLREEIVQFSRSARLFQERFDATALVEWSAYILIYLRLALATSRTLDKQRGSVRRKLRSAKRDRTRKRLLDRFVLSWCQGLGVSKKAEGTIPLDTFMDLQAAALIAFAADVNPLIVAPFAKHRVRSKQRPDLLLTPFLFSAAQWLGQLFRKRCARLDPYHARMLLEYANPKRIPSGIPSRQRREWRAAVRMINSFMTNKGFAALKEGAAAVLSDGQARMVQASSPPARIRSILTKEQKAGRIGPAAPITVEMGWLILPGNYTRNWDRSRHPFEPEDGVRQET